MNKAILTSFTVLCLLSTPFLMGLKIYVKGSPELRVHNIDTGLDYATIQDAIDAPETLDGHTILVFEGIYYEHVVVSKSVSLVGEDRDLTIVDGNRTGSVISIRVNNVSIKGFTIQRSGTSPFNRGIFASRSSDNDISHNTITNNYDGISLDSSSNNVISGNTISSNNNDGISLYSSSSNLVSGNTISSNNCDGIGLHYSANNAVLDNIITNNSDGVRLHSSSNNVVSGNTISSNNNYGITFPYSSNNVVSGNTISSNNNYGMYLTPYSINNIIYWNNFDNTYQVWSDSTNSWDDGEEGNYWSEYAGQDLNGDGIGENPYIIDENNQDTHPLMGMFSVFNITLERETYHVTTICNSTISDFTFEIGSETGNKILRFNVAGEDATAGFCRVTIPTELLIYPYVVLVDGDEIIPTLLDASNETHVYLYFTYLHVSHTIRIISSKALHLYYELLDKHVKLQADLYNLNATYYDLLHNYSILLGNYDQLQESYRELNSSYQQHLLDYSKNVHNTRNLVYIFAATTAIFLITTIYLSKRAHASKTKVFEDKQRLGAQETI